MSSYGLLGFRTVVRCWLERLVLEGTPAVLTPKPIGIPLPPENIDINPGLNQQEISGKSLQGETVTEFTYVQESRPEVTLDFGVGTPEIESLIHSRVMVEKTNDQEFVYFDVDPIGTSVAGRTTGQYGFSVAAQTAATTKAQAYYIDPASKLAKPIAIVDSNPTGDQMAIGAQLGITLSTALVEKGLKIQGLVPATFAKTTAMSGDIVRMVGVRALGVCFDGKVKLFTARYCSPMFGASLGGDPKRQVKLKILPDANDGTCLGWNLKDVPVTLPC